jgi:hypothetical protein
MDLSLWGQSRTRWGGVLPPSPVLAPGSALGSRPRVALSSAQVLSVYLGALWSGKFLLLGPGRHRRLSPRSPDRMDATSQLFPRSDVVDRGLQTHRIRRLPATLPEQLERWARF